VTAGGFFPGSPKDAEGGKDNGGKATDSESSSAPTSAASEGGNGNWLERLRKRWGSSKETKKTENVKDAEAPPFASFLYQVKSTNGGEGYTRKQLASVLAQRIRSSRLLFPKNEVPSPIVQAAILRVQLEGELGDKVVVNTDGGAQELPVDDFFDWSGVLPNIKQSGGASAASTLDMNGLRFLDGVGEEAIESAQAHTLYSQFAHYLERTQDFNMAGQLLLRDLYRSGIEKVESKEFGTLSSAEFLRSRGFMVGQGSGMPMFLLGWPKEEVDEDLSVELIFSGQPGEKSHRMSMQWADLKQSVDSVGLGTVFGPNFAARNFQVQTRSSVDGPFGVRLLFNRYSFENFVRKFFPERAQGAPDRGPSGGPEVTFPLAWFKSHSPSEDPLSPEDAMKLAFISKKIAPLMTKIENQDPLTTDEEWLLTSAQADFRSFERELRNKRPRD
jgi:hypothetical protein